MITLVLVLLAVFVVLWLLPSKKGSSAKGVVDVLASSFTPSVSLFGQQLDEEAEMLATAYRDKAKAARQAEVIEKASSLLASK